MAGGITACAIETDMTDRADHKVETAQAGQRQGSGERRRVTVLFADVVDFTSTAERLGEEGAFALVQRIFAIMAKAVAEHGGSVETFTGDGIMAVFGVPVALEDATLRACKAALQIQERVAAAGTELEAEFGVHPRLRIGINTGPVVAGWMEDGRAGIGGDTVNLAARLQALAAPATIVLSEPAQRLVEGLVKAEFVGAQAIKGKSEPQNVYRLDAVYTFGVRFDGALSRGLTQYVGRTRELALLRGKLVEAATNLSVVDLVGEPGMGKSRLLHEFLKTVDRTAFVVLRGSCASDGAQTAFGLFVDLVRSSFRLSAADDEDEIGRKLTNGLSTLGLGSAENHALLRHLLGLKVANEELQGLDGPLIGLRTRNLLQRLLRARCKGSPAILVLEDLHWIDSVSEELLGRIVANETDLRLLVLHTRRPEYRPPWIDPGSRETVPLDPLSFDETSAFVRHRLGVAELPDAVVELVVGRADGNALFAEEIASYLLERGALRRVGETFELVEAADAGALPPSVQSLLAARVDRLAPEDRVLLQAASVIGRSFDPHLLAVVAGGSQDIEPRLGIAEGMDFLTFEALSGNYVFKHALVRDALYESLLSNHRADLHARIAHEIECRSGNRLTEVAETLANHFCLTKHTEKAFVYLVMAGLKSLGTYGITEAGQYLRQADALLDRDPSCSTDDSFAEFVTGYVSFLQLAYEPKQIRDTMEKYRARLWQLTERSDVVAALHHEVWALVLMLRMPEAWTIQMHAERMAARLGDDRSIAYAEAGFFFLDASTSKPSPGIVERGEAAIAAALRTGDLYIMAWLRFLVGWNAFHRGHVARANVIAADLSRVGAAIRDPRSTGLASCLLCWTSLVFDDLEDAVFHAERAIETAITPFDRLNAESGKATAFALLRRPESASLLVALRNEAARHDRWYEYVGNDMSFGISLVLQGQFAKGVRHIEASIEKRDVDYPIAADWYRLALSQLYFEFLGKNNKTSLSTLLRNATFLIHVFVTGRRRILRLLKRAETNTTFSFDSFHTANLYYLFGRYHMLKKDKRTAKAHFLASLHILEAFGRSNILRKVKLELDNLDRAGEYPRA